MESICASFVYGGKQSLLILEVPVGSGPRDTELFADFAQRQRVNPLALDQF